MRSIDCEINHETLQCNLCGHQFSSVNVKRNCNSKISEDIYNNIRLKLADNKTNEAGSNNKRKYKPVRAIGKIKNFTVSAIKHALKGNPTCTQEQIDKRHSICLQCEDYVVHKDRNGEQSEVGNCDLCGCNINNLQIYLNKLAWADQKCPKDKWSKEDE